MHVVVLEQLGKPTDLSKALGLQSRAGFYYIVDAMLKTGFAADEIAKIGGGNYLRIFALSRG